MQKSICHYSTQSKKEIGGFSIQSLGQNLVPAQLNLGQRLRLSKIGVCHLSTKISGGDV
jgi:hypothetical protein